MTWHVLATPASQPDFDKLTDAERASFIEVLFTWTETGPPRVNRRTVSGVEAFQDEVPPGLVVTYVVNETVPYVVAELPPFTSDDALPATVRVACLESYFSNLPVLIEFLTLPRSKKSIHRHDYLPSWNPEPSLTLDRLKREYGFVSEQVSHLGERRVPGPNDPIVNLAPERLRVLAAWLFDEMEEFCKALRISASAYAESFEAFLETARSHLRS